MFVLFYFYAQRSHRRVRTGTSNYYYYYLMNLANKVVTFFLKKIIYHCTFVCRCHVIWLSGNISLVKKKTKYDLVGCFQVQTRSTPIEHLKMYVSISHKEKILEYYRFLVFRSTRIKTVRGCLNAPEWYIWNLTFMWSYQMDKYDTHIPLKNINHVLR